MDILFDFEFTASDEYTFRKLRDCNIDIDTVVFYLWSHTE